jgi:pyruvate kinase
VFPFQNELLTHGRDRHLADETFRCTKIVATIGPACCSLENLTRLVAKGVNVFRINMAHGTRDEHEAMLALARCTGDSTGHAVAILVDLAGPKIRLGELTEDPIVCESGSEFTFVREKASTEPHQLTSGYEQLVDELNIDDRVMLADGTVTLRVIGKQEDRVRCQVISPGTIRSRQGINLPGVHLSLRTLSEQDFDNAFWAAEQEVDLLGISFVRSPNDLHSLRGELAKRHHDPPWLIAKIEKPEALTQLDEIITAADGVMVARGDLGVETDVADLAVLQKRIIARCNDLGRPVIVATQMLDSMQHSTQPSPAEATDVANAILDGTDACMLSGETAIGSYPVESVDMMRRIICATEPLYKRVDSTVANMFTVNRV